MASEASIARNFGSPRVRAVAATASEVMLLSSGPTVMNASRVGSRASSSIWSVPKCVTVTLSRKVKKLKRKRTRSLIHGRDSDSADHPAHSWGDQWRRHSGTTVGGKGTVMDWARILAYVTGTGDQELLARNEYLAAENRILKSQLNGRLKLADAERAMLGKIGHRLGRQALAEVATVARPDTILAWYRKLVAGNFDGSKARRGPGPRVTREVEQLIVRMASENRDWGYDRIVGALANL